VTRDRPLKRAAGLASSRCRRPTSCLEPRGCSGRRQVHRTRRRGTCLCRFGRGQSTFAAPAVATVIDSSLKPSDPRGTVHFRLGHAGAKRITKDRPTTGAVGDSWFAMNACADDPEARGVYVRQVNAAWGFVAFGFLVAIPLVAFSVRSLAGVGGGNAVLATCVAGAAFCLAGCVSVLWRMYCFVPKAKRLVSRGETEAGAYAVAMRGIMPRNSTPICTLIFQALVSVTVVVLVL